MITTTDTLHHEHGIDTTELEKGWQQDINERSETVDVLSPEQPSMFGRLLDCIFWSIFVLVVTAYLGDTIWQICWPRDFCAKIANLSPAQQNILRNMPWLGIESATPLFTVYVAVEHFGMLNGKSSTFRLILELLGTLGYSLMLLALIRLAICIGTPYGYMVPE